MPIAMGDLCYMRAPSYCIANLARRSEAGFYIRGGNSKGEKFVQKFLDGLDGGSEHRQLS